MDGFLYFLWIGGSLGVAAGLLVGVFHLTARQPIGSTPPRAWQRKARFWVIGCFAIATVGLVGVLNAPEESTPNYDTAPAPESKYIQTWEMSYGDTTCSEWLDLTTDEQQFAASADILAGARSVDGVDELPADSMIEEFAGGITTVCVEPSMPLNEAGVGLYLTEPRFQP